VSKGLSPRQFTMKNAIARLESMGDPLAPIREGGPPLEEVLKRAGSR
jgi:hypothetical protein